ncbi:MAG TPA: response regulator transcription factor [Bacteroidales bacterium]|nr:response regulator transcription factor [Bacteroidales bacterium]HRX95511.1 response regulator transcription factor [Bacteroidales bacterium]
MEKEKLKIILADDHEILLDSLEGLLSKEDDLEIIGKVNSGLELIERVKISMPDLCIVDMDMPGMNGMVASEKLLAEYPDIKIMILSMHSETSLIKNMVKLGISGYLTKTTDRDEFIFAIRQILKGKSYFSNKILEAVAKDDNPNANQDDLSKIGSLSDREREIVQLVCEGLTNKQIGDQLFLSHKTIDNHRTNIMRKLEVHNVVELIRFCIRNGIAD